MYTTLTFFVRCDVPGCKRTFRNVNTYKSHLRRTHRVVDLHDEQVLVVDDVMDIAEKLLSFDSLIHPFFEIN